MRRWALSFCMWPPSYSWPVAVGMWESSQSACPRPSASCAPDQMLTGTAMPLTSKPRGAGAGRAHCGTGEYLPLLLRTVGAVSADWAAWQPAPQVTV
jgi:hypothetical protein